MSMKVFDVDEFGNVLTELGFGILVRAWDPGYGGTKHHGWTAEVVLRDELESHGDTDIWENNISPLVTVFGPARSPSDAVLGLALQMSGHSEDAKDFRYEPEDDG